MRLHLGLLLLVPACLNAAEGRAAELARAVREAGLDPEECYRIRDLNFAREDIRIYLTDGYLMLGRPVEGARLAAVFSADVEGGEAEILLMPPHRSERMSLALFTGSPNLSERFRQALMIFSDDTAAQFLEQIRARGMKKSPEMGALMNGQWDPVARNMAGSFQVRLVDDLLISDRKKTEGFFYATMSGARLGNFDVVYDPRQAEQISVGQVAHRDNRVFFDCWAIFQARSFRTGQRAAPSLDVQLRDIRIEATLEPSLELSGVTRATLTLTRPVRGALGFEVSRRMRISEVLIEGRRAEVFQRESLRANAIRGNDNDLFLVLPEQPLEPGRPYQIEFRHAGQVIASEGDGIYYVGSRGSWYPQRGLQFARYDISFRYPSSLNLVSTGTVVENRTEGEWRITRRKTESPIRQAGFNLGEFEHTRVERGGFTVELYANRKLEKDLQARAKQLVLLPPQSGWPPRGRRQGEVLAIPVQPPAPPSPAARLQTMAGEIIDAFQFMAERFGPPPLKELTVAPIPATFGQGFPGLVYLSTISYLDPKDRAAKLDSYQQVFFSQILHAHETAHQWWGNLVLPSSYADDWLMEALANYSALCYMEKTDGPRSLDSALEDYRLRLLRKDESGKTLESGGPVTWGLRLSSSVTPGAWRSIVYEKGSWILHMLRRRFGDERFFQMLAGLVREYQYRTINTEQFRALAARFAPPGGEDPALEAFFESWVYGTGIPSLSLKYTVRGKAPNVKLTGTVTQAGVEESFSTLAPVEIHFARGKPLVRWVRTASEPEEFVVPLRQAPARVLLDPAAAVLTRR